MAFNEVYGPGGFDPSKPNNNVVGVEEVPDAEITPPLADVFASVPVISLEEANDTLLALKAALEARGIV